MIQHDAQSGSERLGMIEGKNRHHLGGRLADRIHWIRAAPNPLTLLRVNLLAYAADAPSPRPRTLDRTTPPERPRDAWLLPGLLPANDSPQDRPVSPDKNRRTPFRRIALRTWRYARIRFYRSERFAVSSAAIRPSPTHRVRVLPRVVFTRKSGRRYRAAWNRTTRGYAGPRKV